MGKKCCGRLSTLGLDYSGINRIPYFGKRKDRDAWLREQKADARTEQVSEEETVESIDIVEPLPEISQIEQSIFVQIESPEVEPTEDD